MIHTWHLGTCTYVLVPWYMVCAWPFPGTQFDLCTTYDTYVRTWYMITFSFFLFFFLLSSGGWVKIKLKLPHFHVWDSYMCFDLTHAPVATTARAHFSWYCQGCKYRINGLLSSKTSTSIYEYYTSYTVTRGEKVYQVLHIIRVQYRLYFKIHQLYTWVTVNIPRPRHPPSRHQHRMPGLESKDYQVLILRVHNWWPFVGPAVFCGKLVPYIS